MHQLVRTTLFGGQSSPSWLADLGSTVLRVFAGLSLAIAHGWGKIPPSEGFVANVEGMGFPVPILFAWSAGLAEFAGGILLAIGLCTRPAAFFILCTMGVAAGIAHSDDPYRDKELALLFGAVAVMFLLAGSGRFSVDCLLR